MVVRYIDHGKRAIFGDLVYTRDDKTGYYLNSTVHQRLHRAVYERCNGAIPKGYHIHHVDHNRGNNEPENLIALPQKEHLKRHEEEMTEELREKLRSNIRQKAMPAAAEWHRSAEGRAWHAEHYKQHADALHGSRWMACAQCGVEFYGAANGMTRFCSNACKSAWRRKARIDNEVRKCIYCGREYETNKYSSGRTCSRSCANRMRAALRSSKACEAATGGTGV